MKIKLFGMLSEAAGKSEIEITDFNAENLDALKKVVEADFPQLKKMTYIIAVNKKITDENTSVNPEDEVAFLPPFAGG